MSYLKKILTTLIGFLFIYILLGCSPSSRSQRFNRTKTNSENSAKQTDQTTASNRGESGEEIIIVRDVPEGEEEFDELPVEENPIDKSKFIAHYEKLKNFNVALTPREKILFEVIKYLDTPYKYGGNSENGIDCSAFTKQVFENSVTVNLPRSAREQFGSGEKIDKDNLKFGDLVFFNTRRRNNPGHVGIYLGEGQFVHASLQLGVTVSSLEEKYYKTRYSGARRVMNNEN